MPTVLENVLDQALDIAGSLAHSDSLTPLTNESSMLGSAISGQTGSGASITNSGGTIIVTGLTGMTAQSVGRFLTISGAATGANNGTFLIVELNSATSVDISNASGATDANNGSIIWTERNSYSLQDDLNYVRTDRAAIKGVAYDQPIPTYTRCTDTVTLIPANLSNIAGKTTDAKSLVVNRKFENAIVGVGDGYTVMTGVGLFSWADATNRTGVPLYDGADAGNDRACYVEIIDPETESALEVLTGAKAGERIFGFTRAGVSGVDGYSVEVQFRSVMKGDSIANSTVYTWESGQPSIVDLYYGFRECLDTMDETALRVVLTNGIIGDADLSQDITDVRTTIGISDDVTDLAGLLTNTSNFYIFSDLPDGTPSVVEALNTLNEQIGDRNYSGSILSDGYTITQSLQQLANAITVGATGITKIVERLSSDINAGTPHTIPGGNSYTPDNTDNGTGMWVFTRGILRSPGPVVDGNYYDETSTTEITFYSTLKAGDHIHYFITS